MSILNDRLDRVVPLHKTVETNTLGQGSDDLHAAQSLGFCEDRHTPRSAVVDQRKRDVDQLLADIGCPRCFLRHPQLIRLTAETSQQVVMRPATPEFIQICPNCGTLLIISFLPAPRSQSA
jgi:hypothetical protein